MTRLLRWPPVVLFIACLAFSGCGGSANIMNSNRVLQSMTISPSNAVAHNFPNGQVTFTATGIFSQPPSPATVPFVAPFSGSWSVSDLSIATIQPEGPNPTAQCVAGKSGTVTVSAIASANSAGPGAMSIGVTASTTLTCP